MALSNEAIDNYFKVEHLIPRHSPIITENSPGVRWARFEEFAEKLKAMDVWNFKCSCWK